MQLKDIKCSRGVRTQVCLQRGLAGYCRPLGGGSATKWRASEPSLLCLFSPRPKVSNSASPLSFPSFLFLLFFRAPSVFPPSLPPLCQNAFLPPPPPLFSPLPAKNFYFPFSPSLSPSPFLFCLTRLPNESFGNFPRSGKGNEKFFFFSDEFQSSDLIAKSGIAEAQVKKPCLVNFLYFFAPTISFRENFCSEETYG